MHWWLLHEGLFKSRPHFTVLGGTLTPQCLPVWTESWGGKAETEIETERKRGTETGSEKIKARPPPLVVVELRAPFSSGCFCVQTVHACFCDT